MSTTLLRGGRLVQDGCITRCDILLRGKAVDAVLPPDSGAAADFVGTGVPQLLAVAVVAVSYKLRHSTFLSILLGTGAYMALIQLL